MQTQVVSEHCTIPGIPAALVSVGAMETLISLLESPAELVRASAATAVGYMTFNRSAMRILLTACRRLANVAWITSISRDSEFVIKQILDTLDNRFCHTICIITDLLFALLAGCCQLLSLFKRIILLSDSNLCTQISL